MDDRKRHINDEYNIEDFSIQYFLNIDNIWVKHISCLLYTSIALFAGDILLADSKCAHGPPFIMVMSQPHFPQILELPVFIDFPGLQMTVVIHYGKRCV